MLSSLHIPFLLVDGPVQIFEGACEADLLLMDNQTRLIEFMKEMHSRGKTKISFIGDIHHCQSFYERYSAFEQCIHLLHLQNPCSMTDRVENIRTYTDYIAEALDKARLPEVFICANDFIALELIHVLEQNNISVPDDLWVCGFDDAPESRIVSPKLTTVHIHTQAMGQLAAELLFSRILTPEKNYCTVYSETHLVYRESTGNN